MTEAKLANMRYLKACQEESNRLLNLMSAHVRKTQVDMVLGGYKIPEGTNVLWHNALSSLNEKYFPEPDKFVPERWLRGI